MCFRVNVMLVLCLVCQMLPVSLDCLFLVAPSVSSNFQLIRKSCGRHHDLIDGNGIYVPFVVVTTITLFLYISWLNIYMNNVMGVTSDWDCIFYSEAPKFNPSFYLGFCYSIFGLVFCVVLWWNMFSLHLFFLTIVLFVLLRIMASYLTSLVFWNFSYYCISCYYYKWILIFPFFL
jgi:hypothetical protein